MRLEEIAVEHAEAFLTALEDYKKHDPRQVKELFPELKDPSLKGFAAFVRECERQKLEWRPKANKISITRYVLLDDHGALCGNGRMRFPLTDELALSGGNLLFDVPPSKRRQGYGALTLNRMLFEAVRAGLARVLVSCAVDNLGARLAIEKNRGELVTDPQESVLRYWIRLR